MVAEPSVRGSRLFPVVCIQLGTATRSSRIALSPAVQACALATLVAAATALVYLGISQIGYVRLISNERSALARVESANVDLEDNVANLRDRLAITTRGRAVAEDRVSVLARQADALRGQLESTETKLHGVEQMLAERQAPPPDPVAKAGPAQFVQSESAPPEANPPRSGVTAPDSSTEAKRRTEGIVELARRSIDEFQHVLASAGVNVARLFSQFGVNHAEGGPFVPPRANEREGVVTDLLARIRGLAKSLPLSTPLEHYQVGSRFGPRRDPFNGRLAVHAGLDLDAAYMAPVYATAPGIVIYAGYRGAYGKVVEIDHGNGIATLYGHMHRYTVSVGQRVEAHAQIGLVGSTGRASGPHVHYEVIVNGQPQDPEKFIELAHLIAAAQK